ncbi:BgTH12-01131 [Blumeria graminis f. sp. triticale]|uniref:BgTH12-01131 n=1 Tax=Blumeria graminis f. sp. triticale TaxID=1689686 RepID=A0A9W4GHY6_BLUGR|nr:BgTH12-01131 [Blumeria graminis f. sp. triticale]
MLATTACHIPDVNLDISFLLKATDSTESAPTLPNKSPPSSSPSAPSSSHSASPFTNARPNFSLKRSVPSHAVESPAKKQSKWSPEEDSLIIELRGKQMKWDDISKCLPGRSAISCRLHYQNYLERRSEWDEERKNKLARLYERFKPEIWAKVAEEMAVPWRAAEAMHWQLGEAEMARRAGVIPFSLSPSMADSAQSNSNNHRPSGNRGHSHSHSHSISSGSRHSISHSRSPSAHGTGNLKDPISSCSKTLMINKHNQKQESKLSNGNNTSRISGGESTPRSVPIPSSGESLNLSVVAVIGRSAGQPLLPSVAEMTTGISPYNTPAYATSGTSFKTMGHILPAIGILQSPYVQFHHPQWTDLKHRQSPENNSQETRRS